ncbi:hypothetical protein ADK77_40990 [Streptomyces antibioticus]|nr:hypothetical protein ADK77_40990 [Streptomyces antibioticus]
MIRRPVVAMWRGSGRFWSGSRRPAPRSAPGRHLVGARLLGVFFGMRGQAACPPPDRWPVLRDGWRCDGGSSTATATSGTACAWTTAGAGWNSPLLRPGVPSRRRRDWPRPVAPSPVRRRPPGRLRLPPITG